MEGPPLVPGSNRTGETRALRRPYLRVHAVNVFVRDQEQSLRFYVDRLGFDIAFDARLSSGERWLAVAPPDGSALLALIAPHPDSRDFPMIGRNTGVVFVTEDVVAQYGEWRKKGVRFTYTPRLRRVEYNLRLIVPAHALAPGQEDRHRLWGGVFTQFKDPDGNAFSLVGFDEVSREIELQRRAMVERLEAERRNAQELEIAKEVQARLFPQTLPAIRTLDYAGICIQARQVGGDYYDFIELGRGKFGLVIGDIAGKGIAAALLMANLQATLRIQTSLSIDQELLLRSVNHVFLKNSSESAYATLFFAEYDDEARRLRYTNCGHLPGLLLRGDGTVDRLASTSTVLGLFPDWDSATDERTLFPGDTLAVYTDGVTEAFDAAEEDFGEERLIEALQRHCHLPAEAIVCAVVDEVQRFGTAGQKDDITLTVARCR